MITIKSYIDERIDALNALDAQLPRWVDCVEKTNPETALHSQKVLMDLQMARDIADQSLLDLYSIRSAEFATSAVTANVEAAWSHLQATLCAARATFGDFDAQSDVAA